MTHIRVENLSVKFNSSRKNVLNNISFEFDTDERILILGQSGSGKSTLLLSLMGIIQRLENAEVDGEVFIGDKSVREMTPKDVCQKMGLVFQNPESQFCMLYPEDEVAFGLENLNVKPSSMQKIIDESLEDFGFTKDRHSQINNLSGGQQQRLALASIFAQGAEMFLLDEPTANLDPKGRKQVAISSKVAADKGKGLLVVEHNLEPWLPFLDRLIILNGEGGILDDASPRDIFKKWGKKLEDMGIWRPYSVRIYEELDNLGYHMDYIPLNSHELIQQNIPKSILSEAFNRIRKKHCIKENNKLNKDSVIDIDSLYVGYKKEEDILSGATLKVYEGDFFALVGSNGSGKSTLAKTLIHMIKPKGGTIKLLGKKLSDMSIRDVCNIVGYVFQNPEHQFVEDTVWSEIAYSVNQIDNNEKKKKQIIKNLLKEFELESVAKNNPFSLSGGQKRRLSVATMLVGNQKILILDEPTFGQDERSAYNLMNKLSKLNSDGITIFMITHDLDLVEEYANRVAVIYDKKIAFCGSVNDLWKQNYLIKKSGLELPFKIKVMSEGENENDKYE